MTRLEALEYAIMSIKEPNMSSDQKEVVEILDKMAQQISDAALKARSKKKKDSSWKKMRDLCS